MNAITKYEGGALALPESELIQTLRDSLYPGAKDASIKMVIGWCRATGKDPMKRPVHLVPMRVKKVGGGRDDYEWRDIVMPGIVDYRIDAARTGEHAGNDDAVFGPDVTEKLDGVEITYPQWCEFRVYRMVGGEKCLFSSGKVRWLETYATAKNDTRAPNAMWKKRPYGQIEKCAEAMALRRAFPEVGAQPTAEEMEGKSLEGDVIDASTGEIIGGGQQQPAEPKGPPTWPDDAFQKQLPRWSKAVAEGLKSVDDILALAKSKGALTADQEKAIKAIRKGVASDAQAPAQQQEAAAKPAQKESDAPPWDDEPKAADAGAVADSFVAEMEAAERQQGASE